MEEEFLQFLKTFIPDFTEQLDQSQTQDRTSSGEVPAGLNTKKEPATLTTEDDVQPRILSDTKENQKDNTSKTEGQLDSSPVTESGEPQQSNCKDISLTVVKSPKEENLNSQILEVREDQGKENECEQSPDSSNKCEHQQPLVRSQVNGKQTPTASLLDQLGKRQGTLNSQPVESQHRSNPYK